MRQFPYTNLIAITLLIIALVAFKWHYLRLPFFWDEAWPYSNAVHSMYNHGLSLRPDAIPPEISRGHPLLFYCLAAGWMKLFGTTIITIHLFSLFISILLLLAVYWFCKHAFTERTGVIACWLLAVQPVFLAQSGLLLPEMLVALFFIAALLAWLKGKYYIYILIASLLMLTKESGIVLPVSLFIHMILQIIFKRNEERFSGKFIYKSLIVLSPLAVLVCHFFLVKTIFGWYVYPEYAGFISFNVGAVFSHIQSIGTFIFFYYGRIVYVLIALISILILFRKENKVPLSGSIQVLLIFSLVYFLFSVVNLYSPRYYLTLLAILIVLFSDLLVRVLNEKRLVLYSITVILFLLSAVLNIVNPHVYDHTLDYADGVVVNKEVVAFCEENQWYDKNIHAHFLTMKSLTDSCSGYLSKGRKFTSVSKGYDENREVYIKTSVERDPEFDEIQKNRNLLLLKRFESRSAWAEIYIRNQ